MLVRPHEDPEWVAPCISGFICNIVAVRPRDLTAGSPVEVRYTRGADTRAARGVRPMGCVSARWRRGLSRSFYDGV